MTQATEITASESDVKEILRLSDLVPDPNNANSGTPRGQQMVEDSLRTYGAGRSILVDKNGITIAGAKTLQASADIDLPIRVIQTDGRELVVVQRTDLDLATDPRARELGLVDNRSSEVGLEWNIEVLASMKSEGIATEKLWTDKEWNLLVPETPGSADAKADAKQAAALNEKWRVKSGDLFIVGTHRLLCGDCTKPQDVVRLMAGAKADAVLSDPIYGQDQEGVTNDAPETFEPTIRGAVKALPITDGVVVAFQSPRTFTVWLDAVREAGHRFERLLTLYKAAQCTFPWRGWILKSESILVSSIGKANWQDVHPYAHDCYYLPEVSGELDESIGWHGSVKPLAVVMDLMARICAPGAIVFDGFVGTGTTLIAAQNLERSCYCMDSDEGCVAICLERASLAFPGIAIEREKQ